jgi:hypothetical protein
MRLRGLEWQVIGCEFQLETQDLKPATRKLYASAEFVFLSSLQTEFFTALWDLRVLFYG